MGSYSEFTLFTKKEVTSKSNLLNYESHGEFDPGSG